MDNLIDKTYFVGDIQLAIGHDTQAMDNLIASKQKGYLRTVLGETEALNFANDLTGIVPATQKWLDFLDGKTIITIDKDGNNQSAEYEGFKVLLARFMYYEYIFKFESKQTGAGKRQQDIDNSTHVDPSMDVSRVYADTIRYFYGLDWNFLFSDYNAEKYGGNPYRLSIFNSSYRHIYDAASYYNSYYQKINITAERLKGTVYNYLYYMNQDDSTNFPNWNFTHIETQAINLFNL